MTLDRDGHRVAVISGGEVRIWDLEAGELVATLRGHDSPVSAVALSPDGTRLFALHGENRSSERVRVRVSVWDWKPHTSCSPSNRRTPSCSAEWTAQGQIRHRTGGEAISSGTVDSRCSCPLWTIRSMAR